MLTRLCYNFLSFSKVVIYVYRYEAIHFIH